MLLLLVLLIIVYYVFLRKEHFHPINDGDAYELAQDNKNCCLVEKKYIKSNKDLYSGTFDYNIVKAEGDQCLKNYSQDSTKQVIFSNTCSRKSIGSCRNVNKECVDFVDKDFCDEYNMTWSEKPCNLPLDYKWEDKVKFKLPKSSDPGTFTMFPRQIKN